mmetsp:Transcript_106139/g.307078  ORF Transcript_106139/g.307078 Transcript_106139/m.307078 type:complete len:242 (-) Transcript_106139:76-801(-)
MDEAAAADQREKARMKRLARFASPTSPPQGPGLADAPPPPPQLRATSSSSSDVFYDCSPQSTPRGAAGATPPHKKAALSSVSATDAAASSPRQAKSPGAVASAALVRVLQITLKKREERAGVLYLSEIASNVGEVELSALNIDVREPPAPQCSPTHPPTRPPAHSPTDPPAHLYHHPGARGCKAFYGPEKSWHAPSRLPHAGPQVTCTHTSPPSPVLVPLLLLLSPPPSPSPLRRCRTGCA